MSKTRITISARRRPKPKEEPKPKPKQDKGSGGPNLPGDRYTDAQCRVTVADISTLYRYGNGIWTSPLTGGAQPGDVGTVGRAVIGTVALGQNAVNQHAYAGDVFGIDAPDPRISGTVEDSNEGLLYFLNRQIGV